MQYYIFQSQTWPAVTIVIKQESLSDAILVITELLGHAMASKFTCVAIEDNNPIN